LNVLAKKLHVARKIREAILAEEKSLGILEKIDSEENAEIADTLNEIGWVYHDKGDYKKPNNSTAARLKFTKRSSGLNIFSSLRF